MRLREVFDVAKNIELKQLAVAGNEEMMFSLLNLALNEVYSSLNLLQEEQIIRMVSGQNRYRLLDTSIKIVNVYGPTEPNGLIENIPVNDIHADYSVFTPQPYVMHIPNPIDGESMSVIHMVVPPYITKENIDTIDLIVPPYIVEPIVNYMGYRAHISVDGGNNSEWPLYYQRFKTTINNAKRMLNSEVITNMKLLERGFV